MALLIGLLLVATVGALLWAIFGRGETSSQQPGNQVVFGPAVVSHDEIRSRTADLGHTVFWLGGDDPRLTELTILADGTVHIGYLPAGQTEAGGDHLIVSSWPTDDPMAQAETASKAEAAMSREGPDGALYVTRTSSANNAYLTFPQASALGEVYDPKAGRAWRIVGRDQVQILDP